MFLLVVFSYLSLFTLRDWKELHCRHSKALEEEAVVGEREGLRRSHRGQERAMGENRIKTHYVGAKMA